MKIALRRLAGFLIALPIGVFAFTQPTLAQQTASLKRQDQREVPVISYAPSAPACRGIAIISPGAGGSEQGYAFLGEAMSSLGYLAVVMGHPESGPELVKELVRAHGLRDALARLITTPEAYRGRFLDITAATRWALERCPAGERILIGHSMGAATVMMEAGARNKVGIERSSGFDAYIALSPQGAGMIFPEHAWSEIRKPVLLLTGTRDTELGSGTWQSRTEPFGDMPAGCKWLGVIEGATHMNFAGRGESRAVEASTVATIRAFLEGVRRGTCGLTGPVPGIDISTR